MSDPEVMDGQLERLRESMIEQIIAHAAHVAERTGRPRLGDDVLTAMAAVPRHMFVPLEMKLYAYLDTPLPIGHGKTISQPFIVALMTDLLEVAPTHSVLEIGTGLGYQAAVLASLAKTVETVEIIEELASAGERRLKEAGFDNVTCHQGDGNQGWSAAAPYDRIIATAAPDIIPPSLIGQLKPGGRMVVPAGLEDAQTLFLVTRGKNGRVKTEEILPVRFSQLMTH